MTFDARDARSMREGRHLRLHDRLGAHPGRGGTRFAVWAPNAAAVSVIGEWNAWAPGADPLAPGEGGVWQGAIAGARPGALYKYHLRAPDGRAFAKADPFAIRHEAPPGTASQIWRAEHAWRDQAWLARRAAAGRRDAPIAIYEVHLGSWMRDGDRMLGYRDLAPRLVEHAQRVGFTHVELMPVTEHPFYGSWGYETTGYFAATARYGAPEDLMAMIDELHRAGLGVIVDWVPAHFPRDAHGLADFDGTPLYEHGIHAEWDTAIFDFGRPEVRCFLLSSALSWLERFHADGLRVDGMASMLYRDDRTPNAAAVELLQKLTEAIAREHPDAITIAEESTAWPGVTRAVAEGGLGFTYKWDMGWSHDTLAYLARDPGERRHHHRELTMRGLYAATEAFVLPLSHDDVGRGGRSLLGRMPGDRWQQLATIRLLLAYMYSLPGKKLLFMGDELAATAPWDHDAAIDWRALDDPAHRSVQLLVGELDQLYRSRPALHELDCDPAGFHWIDADDAERSVLVYERISRAGARIVCALNFVPVPHPNYRVGVVAPGVYRELLNTDAVQFGGSGQGNLGAVEASPVRAHGRELSLNLTVPPLGAVFLTLA